MEKNSGSVKCAQCGLTNFADAEACKRCGAVIQATCFASPAANPKLSPCPDCGASVSRNAESCPQCGSFFQVLRPRAAERSRAWWAFTIGWGILASSLIAFMLSIALFFLLGGVAGALAMVGSSNLLASRAPSNEASALSTLRTISSAEATYSSTVGNGSYGTLEQLVESGLVDEALSKGEGAGYRFEIRLGPSNDYGASGFEAHATPIRYGNSGVRSFYVSETGVVRAADVNGAEAGAVSPSVGRYTTD